MAFSQWTPADGIKANFFDKVGAALKVKRKNYGIVIDAGSTGSRALVYEFISSRCGDVVKLHKEFFHETQPGLSDFVTNPEGVRITLNLSYHHNINCVVYIMSVSKVLQAARSIQKLLLMAKQDIPRRHWAETFVTLMATAGLRLLPQQQQEQLLKCVNKTLVNSGFRTGPDSVSIIDGQYEGLLSWFSINLLLGTSCHCCRRALSSAFANSVPFLFIFVFRHLRAQEELPSRGSGHGWRIDTSDFCTFRTRFRPVHTNTLPV